MSYYKFYSGELYQPFKFMDKAHYGAGQESDPLCNSLKAQCLKDVSKCSDCDMECGKTCLRPVAVVSPSGTQKTSDSSGDWVDKLTGGLSMSDSNTLVSNITTYALIAGAIILDLAVIK